jgi:alpha-glucosidase
MILRMMNFKWWLPALLSATLVVGYTWAAEAPTIDSRAAVTARADGFDVQIGTSTMRVTAVADDILRVRVAPGGQWPEDASWVVPADVRARSVSVQSWSGRDAAGFRTAVLEAHIERSSQRLIIADLAGHEILADAMDRSLAVHGTAFSLRKIMPASEHYFGLGDKTGPLDRRGESFIDWNTDAYHFQESTDPLYKSVPFFIATGGPAGSYGVLLDNTWRSWFDFGKKDPRVLAFGSVSGPIDYYVIYGPSFKRVVSRYTDLSGKAPLMPQWALGFQQSRYSYMSATEVRDIASRLRTERLPADIIWMDIDYQDRNRVFTTNPVTFPDLPGLARDLRAQGLRLVAITDLHVADAPGQGYAPYDSGAAGDDFVKNSDGSVFVGKVWPGPSVFPDFTQSRTRDWWGGLFNNFMAAGISGFWNDMNEPAVFESANKTMPLDVVHRIEEPGFLTRKATHAEIHNIYGMENSRATYEGMQHLAPDERPFVMTRASFAGGQRYASTWTGDNSSTWNHLKLSISMLLNLGLSGFSYSGTDVGGYKGTPSPELMTRWIEIASFTPIFRAHSEKGSIRKEPWANGPEQTAIRRRFIEERYRLMPYLYALADENSRTGAPLMRPVFYEFPEALTFGYPCEQDTTFLLGDRLLIAPPPDLESPGVYPICLPAGRWFDYWTGLEVTGTAPVETPVWSAGVKAQYVQSTPSLEKLPVFVRAGAIVPRQPLVQSTAFVPEGPLSLEVYPGDDCHGTLYADDGHSMAYRRGVFLRQTVRCTVTAGGIDIDFDARTGTYQPWWHELAVSVHGWSGPGRAILGDREVKTELSAQDHALRMTIADQPGAARLSIHRLN